MIASWEAWNSELQINVFESVRLQNSVLYKHSIHKGLWMENPVEE